MVWMANEIAQRGCRVSLVVGSGDGPWRGEVSGAVAVVVLGCRRMSKAIVPLARYLRRRAPDAVISALTHANLCLVAAAWLSGFSGRIVLSERNSLDHITSASGAKSRAKMWLMSIMYPKADAIVCVSKAMAAEFAEFLGNRAPRLPVIYNPVHGDRLREKSSEAPEFDLACPPERTLVAVGRLTPQKDFGTLIEAIANLTSRDAHLFILGEGPERAALEQLAGRLGIADRVHLAGFVENPYAVMARAHVFVLSSRYEGMPNALLEALALGCNAVSTDCPTGPEEIMAGYDGGRLVPVGDVSALSAAIDAALAERGRRDHTALLARFDPERIVAAYLAEICGETVNALKSHA